MMQSSTTILIGMLLLTPAASDAQSTAPSSEPTQEAPASQPQEPPREAAASGEKSEERREKYEQYLMLISSWSGSGISQLKPADPTQLAPLGGSVFNDTTALFTDDNRKGLQLGLGAQLGGSLGLDFEKQTSVDAYLGLGAGVHFARLTLGVFGGGGFDGIGLLSEDANLFKLPTAAYGYVNGKANMTVTENLAIEASTSILARVGEVDELRIVGRLIRLSSNDFNPEQEGTAFGFAYTDYDGTAESFSILWSLSR